MKKKNDFTGMNSRTINLTNIYKLKTLRQVRDYVCVCVCVCVARSRHSRWTYQKMLLAKVVAYCMRNVLHPKFFTKVAKKRQKKPKIDFPYNYS